MKGPKHANMLQEPICVEVLVITVFLWAAIWGFLDLLAERLESDARRACFYCVLFVTSGVMIWVTPGLTTCRVL